MKRPLLKALFAVATATVAALVFASNRLADDDADFGTMAELRSPEVTLQTQYYRFRYPAAFAERVQRLAAVADRIHAEVGRRLNGSPAGNLIDVNMLQRSGTHAGSATWDSIRLDLRHAHDDHHLERTLAHETVHVLSLRISDRRSADAAHTLKVFEEGLAEYVALQIAPDPAEADGRFIEAALVYERSRLEPALLLDSDGFLTRFGEHAAYPLGVTWITAMVEACGSSAPARAVRALARVGAPKDLRGEVLWRDMLQSIRCDATQVALQWSELLTSKATALTSEMARVPTLGGGVVRTDEDSIVLRVHPQTETAGPVLESPVYFVLVRGSSDDAASQYETFSGEPQLDGSVEFSVAHSSAKGNVLAFQFGVSWLRSGVTVSHTSEWQRSTLPR